MQVDQTKRWRLVAAVAILALTSSATLAGEVIQIKIKNLAFSPAQVTAHVGDSIEWVNEDFVGHTATGKNKEWDVNIPGNRSGRVVLDRAGKIDYFCRFHPSMTGTITVQ
jgi:plastocyanin